MLRAALLAAAFSASASLPGWANDRAGSYAAIGGGVSTLRLDGQWLPSPAEENFETRISIGHNLFVNGWMLGVEGGLDVGQHVFRGFGRMATWGDPEVPPFDYEYRQFSHHLRMTTKGGARIGRELGTALLYGRLSGGGALLEVKEYREAGTDLGPDNSSNATVRTDWFPLVEVAVGVEREFGLVFGRVEMFHQRIFSKETDDLVLTDSLWGDLYRTGISLHIGTRF